jgi:cytochrome c oxidase assembly protein subunit 15
MRHISYQPWLHRYAAFTAAVALLLPILMGALVTTLDAGMAFPDYPTSDGHNMFLYPWLASIGNLDKFLEHGHRLAGALVGTLSIGLACWCWKADGRAWVRGLGFAVLLAVILQGLIGGFRVIQDSRDAAMFHGVFASWIFAAMSVVSLATSRGWFAETKGDASSLPTCRWTSWLFVVLVAAQYVLGGMLRHRGMVLYEHIGFAAVVMFCAMFLFVTAANTRQPWLIRPAFLLLVCVVGQLLIGGATYVVRFGFGDYVAVQNSLPQISVRTAHVLMGMLVWMLGVTLAVRVQRLIWNAPKSEPLNLGTLNPASGGGMS